MAKKSGTKVEAAPAAIKATKPLKKGKRDPEDDLDTKVNLKKQKKDLVAAVQKKKAEKKVPKKVESSDEESDSDSEEEDKEPARKKAVASTNGSVAKKAKDESSSEEESSDEEEVAVAKKPAAAKPAVKDSSSSDEEDDSEDESEDEKPVAKKAAPVAAKATSSSDESEEDSDEESEDEKPAPKETKTAKKESSSDESGSDESESEDEEETPKKKSSDVETVDAEKQQPKTPSTPATGGSKTLFVANLPFQVEKTDVEEFFKEAGQVVDVRFAMSKDDGSFRGFGHVEFASAGEAQKALEFNGRPLLGRELRLDVAQERGERPANTPQSGYGGGGGPEVFVKGFDSSLPVNDIKSALSEHFASCGEITRVSVPVDRETGGSRGIAYIQFKEGTEKAFELNGSEMGGWNLIVDEPRPKENNNSGGFNSGRSSYGGGRDNGRGRGRGRGRDNFRGRGRGRENSRGRPSFTLGGNKKTTFSDE